MKDVYILAVETTCDETSIAIVKNGKIVISDTILTQMQTHAEFGGVVPEIASRMHCENITMVLDQTLRLSDIKLEDIDAIAVSYAPGLMGSLLVGIEFAKTLSYLLDKPLIKVNHLIGHIYASKLEYDYEYPLLALIVSGGHTELVKMTNDYEFELLGATTDDAIGEAYDKVARVLGIPYPGGPGVEKAALSGQVTYNLPKSVVDETYNFSYSGLKSSVINLVNKEKMKGNELRLSDLAASFQTVAVEQLTRKLDIAMKKTTIKNVIVAGGVSANKYLRSEISKVVESNQGKLLVPSFKYCTDNAAMIGVAAYPLYLKKEFTTLALNGISHINIVN